MTYGLEIEANLVGQSGQIMAEIHRQVNHPALVLIFDAGNILSQGYSPAEVYQQYLAMKPGMGWMHIKDYHHPRPVKRKRHIDEDGLKNFVPAELGDSSYAMILRDFRKEIPALEKRLKRRGIPGVFLDLEPHLKGGGQFGGFSGPDGMGVAARSLCRVLDVAGIGYHLRDFDDVLAAQGKMLKVATLGEIVADHENRFQSPVSARLCRSSRHFQMPTQVFRRSDFDFSPI